MRQRIDLNGHYATAVRQISQLRYSGHGAQDVPASWPVTLDQLLADSVEDLEAAFSPGSRS